MRFLRRLIAASMLALVAFLAVQTETSPGRLHPVHAQVAELRGESACSVCHGDASGRLVDACGVCHEDIMTQRSTGKGIHGSLKDDPSCGQCHIEHRGRAHELTNDFSFTSAGLGKASEYQHRHGSGLELSGRHQSIECEDCHQHASKRVLETGEKRYLGLDRQCTSCHEDEHKDLFGSDCASCHGQEQEFALAPEFEHSAYELIGPHTLASCEDCHEHSQRGDQVLEASVRSEQVRHCASCHNDEHEGLYGQDCASCHGQERSFVEVAGFDHGPYKLEGEHRKAQCKECHEPTGQHSVLGLLQASSTVPERHCVDCHFSQHTIDFAFSSSGSDSCSDCHDKSESSFWLPNARLTAARHASTGFALSTAHNELECAACHGSTAPLRIENPSRSPQSCAQCHRDPHTGQFDGGSTQGRCIACHLETTFRPSRYDLVDHASTEFPLAGSHRAVRCVACHKEPASGGREFASTSSQCASCHENPHESTFERQGHADAQADKLGCARCHSSLSFRQEEWPDFDHQLWTGYELRGGHRRASCRDCHERSAEADHARPYADASTSCSTCHTDPHLGQFRVRAQNGALNSTETDCGRCHSEKGTFKQHSFDHEKDSRFKLTDQHAALDCSVCHKSVRISRTQTVLRYRPMGRRCIDCHQVVPPKKE